MSAIWVPPAVSRQLKDNTREHNRRVLDMLQLSGRVQELWNRELRTLDPLLRIGKAKDRAHAPGVRPGFWHLVRLNEHAPIWVQPLVGPDGGFVEPSMAMLESLRQSDLQNSRAVRARRAQDEREAESRRNARVRADEERGEELRDRVKAATQTSVSLNLDVPWTQNVDGRRGGRKAA